MLNGRYSVLNEHSKSLSLNSAATRKTKRTGGIKKSRIMGQDVERNKPNQEQL